VARLENELAQVDPGNSMLRDQDAGVPSDGARASKGPRGKEGRSAAFDALKRCVPAHFRVVVSTRGSPQLCACLS
jgi:hypothetical protein